MDFDKIDRTVDVRGHICPYPLIELKVALKGIEPGMVLAVLTDSEPTVRTTVPAFCGKTGHLFEIAEVEKKFWRVLIKKRARPSREEHVR
ncbi:MAG: sulfurtransferase TusA family protein [Acidobacteriota bacterium]